ncbi:unnamed protein product [Bursaphelenchus xylophilus]|uniref:(pine wood nematode) hypothetical protein n=1 Tax=Bursaphelenchus xylophilus TaxID=6326 RepID=A0A1I7STU1_BURXY|nr:unnamed protein product [Bursaphelenchus xylophilus]CAG9107967.1 unnamed protein product [Bursaphelenchus xylophilus]
MEEKKSEGESSREIQQQKAMERCSKKPVFIVRRHRSLKPVNCSGGSRALQKSLTQPAPETPEYVMILWCYVLLLTVSMADEIELPEVICLDDLMRVTFANTARSTLSKGRVYVVGHEESERCNLEFKSKDALHVDIPLLHCADLDPLNNDNNGPVKVNVYIRVSPHPVLITGGSKEFHLECSGINKTNLFGISNPSVNTVCQHHVKTSGKEKRFEEIVFHEWRCSEQYGIEDFIMWIKEVTVISKKKQEVTVISNNGCLKDESIISNLHPSLTGVQKITALSQFFAFPMDNLFRIKTSIVLVPRIINNQVVPYFDCSDPHLGFYTNYIGAVLTTTLTDWITVETYDDLPKLGNEILTCPNLLINQELEPFDKSNNSTESILDLLDNAVLNSSESLIKVNQRDLKVDDIVLNQLDQSITMVMLKNTSRYNIMFPLQRKSKCTWQSLNTLLLVWSITSVLIWMVQLSFKFYSYLIREFEDPLPRPPASPTLSKTWAEPYKLNQNVLPKGSEYLEFERHHFF